MVTDFFKKTNQTQFLKIQIKRWLQQKKQRLRKIIHTKEGEGRKKKQYTQRRGGRMEGKGEEEEKKKMSRVERAKKKKV